MTPWTVRLRYRNPDPSLTSTAPQDRRDLALWLGDVLGRVNDGAHQPVGVVVHTTGFAVALRVEAADSYQAILHAAELVGEVVGDPDRVLGTLHSMSTVPPPWRLIAVLPQPR